MIQRFTQLCKLLDRKPEAVRDILASELGPVTWEVESDECSKLIVRNSCLEEVKEACLKFRER